MCADPGSAESAEAGSLLGAHIHSPAPDLANQEEQQTVFPLFLFL